MGLTFIAVVLLAAAWAAILLPDLRNRAGSPRRADSVKSFRQQLSGLDRTRPVADRSRSAYGRPLAGAPGPRRPRPATPELRAGGLGPRAGAPVRPPMARPALASRSAFLPRSSAEAARRRRLVLVVLATLALLTLATGVLVSGALLVLHLLVDAALAVFAYLSWERSTRTRARASFLALDTVDDDVVVRREASGS